MCHFWNIISDSFLLFSTFAIIRNKWRHSFQAKCAYWHQNECLPSIMHQFDAECDPACEYLTALHAFLICILLTLSLSLSYYLHLPVFLSLAFSLYPSSNFRNFPLGAVQVLRPKLEGALSFPTFLVLPPPDHPNYCLHKKQTNKRNTQKKRFFRNKLIWSSFMLFIHENAQCAPEEWLFDPPVDQDLWPPCWSWDLVLPSSPRGATGNKLLWHSGLCSHGEAHYCSHMAG